MCFPSLRTALPPTPPDHSIRRPSHLIPSPASVLYEPNSATHMLSSSSMAPIPTKITSSLRALVTRTIGALPCPYLHHPALPYAHPACTRRYAFAQQMNAHLLVTHSRHRSCAPLQAPLSSHFAPHEVSLPILVNPLLHSTSIYHCTRTRPLRAWIPPKRSLDCSVSRRGSQPADQNQFEGSVSVFGSVLQITQSACLGTCKLIGFNRLFDYNRGDYQRPGTVPGCSAPHQMLGFSLSRKI